MPKPAKYNSQAIHPEKFCRYIHRFCNQTRLDGYNYCIRHILEDKSAPFKQCTYVHSINKKRCTNAAPKTDKSEKRDNSLCPWHAKRALQKFKILSSKKKNREGSAATTVLRDLEHYCSHSKHDPKYNRDVGLNEKYDFLSPNVRDPMDGPLGSFNSSKGGTANKFKGPARNLKYDGNLTGMSTLNDPLAHSGAYTSKEILRIAILKAKSLQSLYSERLNHTFGALRDARIEYLAESKKEREKKNLGDRYENMNEKFIGKGQLKILKALEKYHRPQGTEKLLCHLADMKYEKMKKTHFLCVFVENGKKCNEKRISLSKYCFNHILNDPNQVLFKPCGLGKNTDCNNPILPIEEDVSCEQHLHLTLLKPKAKESVQDIPPAAADPAQEQEHFQSMDDIASLGLDVVTPGSLFGLDQFGEPGESTDTVLSEDQTDLMPIQPITIT